MTIDSKWGGGGERLKTPFSQYIFKIFKIVAGLKPPSSPCLSAGPVNYGEKIRTIFGIVSNMVDSLNQSTIKRTNNFMS